MMSDQLTFLAIDDSGYQGATIEEKFREFHRRNPAVYGLLRRFALEAVAKGRGKIGMKMLWERMRWEVWMTTDDPSAVFKLNNNYTSRYARLLMRQEPELDGIFETRELRAP